MQLRGSGRTRVVITIDPALDELMLPKMTLQPIVENCIEHGVTFENGYSAIYITSELEEDCLIIHVRDDGPGIDEVTLTRIQNDEQRSQSGAYGIYNVQMRLKLYFGDDYGLTVENMPERGVLVSIRIPLSYNSP
jgi:two-component system sensor histidine kinase YesM